MRKLIGIAIAAAAVAVAGAALASRHGEREDHEEREEDEEHEGRGHHGRDEKHERHGDHEGHSRRASAGSTTSDPETRALYRKECGACHLDFPPSMLPAASHRQIMAGLERHFGQNAELDAEVRARLERWLVENAADGGAGTSSEKAGGAPQRISQLAWFQHKHGRIDARVLARPSVKSIAHCAACHPGAENWDFEDDRAKIPPG